MGTKAEIKAFILNEWAFHRYFSAIRKFLDNLPNLAYPFGELDETKDSDPKSFVFWWRELFHFLGGCLLALPFAWWTYGWLSVGVVFVLIGLKEIFIDVPDSGKSFGFKNVADTLAWGLGCLFVFKLS